MRKLMLGAAAAAFLAVGGCATTTGSGGITTADVQNAAVTACSFLPTAATIASILSANPAIATASQVAALICAAVTGKQSVELRGASAPVIVVNGVPVTIEGTFVKAQGRKIR